MRTRWTRALALACTLAALPAVATVVLAQSIEEMSRAVPVVVRAQVGQVQSSWDAEHTRISTYTELKVLEPLKGSPGASVLVKQPGGEVGEKGQHVAGAARFAPGEEVVLFLEPAPDEAQVFVVNAMAAGKVALEKTKVGEVRAVRRLDGIAFYDLKGAQKIVRPVGDFEDLGPAADFLQRVRRAVRPGSGR